MQSRTPTQVASHAQKYFIRQNNLNKRKRRSSLFDIVSEAPAEPVKAPEVASKVPAGMPGGLSMAFAAGMPGFPGFNPATMPMPPGFGAPNAGAKRGLDEGEKAAAATIAALAGSPIAAAGFAQAAAAAAGSKVGGNPWEVKQQHAQAPTPMGASQQGAHDSAQHAQAAAAAAAAAANPFAAMMAMGAMGQMGAQMPPPAAWMQGYHQFMQQMAAAAARSRGMRARRRPACRTRPC